MAVRSAAAAVAEPAVRGEQDVPGMTAFLDGLKWDSAGLVAVIVQVCPIRCMTTCSVSRTTLSHTAELSLKVLHCESQPGEQHFTYPPSCSCVTVPWAHCVVHKGSQQQLSDAAAAQHVDTGELLMQAFADRAAVSETLQSGLATFYSRSRRGRWCKARRLA